MALTDQQRIALEASQPRIVALWEALQPLKSCVSFMSTGAHPDDETSALLAVLNLRDGLDIAYACATRGEGGQNALGGESGSELGEIRTAEMELAAKRLNMRLYWLSESPNDSIVDFGFSKCGQETLRQWGAVHALRRFVHIVRTEKPDILCPTFLDVPGQHGHHRAMTQLAHDVILAAADPQYNAVALPAWQVKKLYLPAWSGASDAYDDAEPPPLATLQVVAKEEDPITGWRYAHIGEQSRVHHQTQGMGRWLELEEERDWPLHLAYSQAPIPDTHIGAGLPNRLRELAGFVQADELAEPLQLAQNAIDSAIAGFPNIKHIREQALLALHYVRLAESLCPEQAKMEVLHRLERKQRQLSHIILMAWRVSVRVWVDKSALQQGETVGVHVESQAGDLDAINLDYLLPDGWSVHDHQLTVSEDSVLSACYADSYFPDQPRLPAVQVQVNLPVSAGEETAAHCVESVSICCPFECVPQILPKQHVSLEHSEFIINTALKQAGKGGHDWHLSSLVHICPSDAQADVSVPTGWRCIASTANNSTVMTLSVPAQVGLGVYELPVLLDNKPAELLKQFNYASIPLRSMRHGAAIKVCVLQAVLPQVRIGYIGGGHDKVGQRLSELGLSVMPLDDCALDDTAILEQFDTLVIGIFAIKKRPALLAAMPTIHCWVRQGGHLLSLYHRPWDAWDPHQVPPLFLDIGQPSLRWRVTDECCSVTHLIPDHPLLNTPNKITAEDWSGWVKERGLYFAKDWHTDYQALISLADAGEDAHHGALLSARIGLGRHTHTSLILHHQLDQLVPGAFRLMANLVAKPS